MAKEREPILSSTNSSTAEKNRQNVMFIGDRGVGKTTLAVELANPAHKPFRVEVKNHSYSEMIAEYYKPVSQVNEDGSEVSFLQATATPEEKRKKLKIEVQLPSQAKHTFNVQWLDTPGELLSSKPHNQESSDFDFSTQIIKNFESAKGVIFVLTPHRNLINKRRLRNISEPIRDPDRLFPPYERWVKIFSNYLCALEKHATAQHQIAFCLNMIDLCCDPKELEMDWNLKSDGVKFMHIQEKIVSKFFPEERTLINQYHKKTRGNILNFCVTTKYNRSLLELPWTCLASCL